MVVIFDKNPLTCRTITFIHKFYCMLIHNTTYYDKSSATDLLSHLFYVQNSNHIPYIGILIFNQLLG